MKTLTDNQLTGELGETVVKSKILELGHVFEGRGRLETGIDGTIEFRDPATRSMTGLTVVRRQNIWHNSWRRSAECRPRLGLMFRRRACGVASADVRVSVS